MLLAIIGREWPTVQDNQLRRRRIDDPDDVELQVAETTRGLAYVRPMPIDDPEVAPPPDQLKHLQFRDRYLMARQGFLRLDEYRG